jgi:predicted N-acetyltransferase YhbS
VNDSIFADAITSEDGDGRFEARRYPAIKIAKLATHDEYTGRGIGTHMVAKAISIVVKQSRYTGCRIITVDSKPGRESFYGQFGFKKAQAKARNTIPMYFDYHKYLAGIGRPEQPISTPDGPSGT